MTKKKNHLQKKSTYIINFLCFKVQSCGYSNLASETIDVEIFKISRCITSTKEGIVDYRGSIGRIRSHCSHKLTNGCILFNERQSLKSLKLSVVLDVRGSIGRIRCHFRHTVMDICILFNERQS